MRTDEASYEATLLSAVAGSDRSDALEELYQRYAAKLYGFGVRMLGDRDLAEELVQETFLRLWRSARSYDPDRGSVAAFVFTMARRIAIDLWRRPSSRPFEPETDRSEPVDKVDAMLTSVAVQEALRDLSPAHREVLELTYRADLKQADIAAVLGIPLGTVKTRTYYALRALRLALQERGLDE